MKIAHTVTLAQALDEISQFTQTISSGDSEIDGTKLHLDDEVELHIEFEEGSAGPELEFEIKWRTRAGNGGKPQVVQTSTGPVIPQEEIWEAEKGPQPPR